jgi:hypothetical protein
MTTKTATTTRIKREVIADHLRLYGWQNLIGEQCTVCPQCRSTVLAKLLRCVATPDGGVRVVCKRCAAALK